MLPLYFLAQILAALVGWPFALVLRLRRPDKFRRLCARLRQTPPIAPTGRKRIWLHALSVGEISSAAPLARAIRGRFPDAFLVITVATASGETLARRILTNVADVILPAPLDWLPTVRRHLRRLRPDVFILVETDFWPGLLFSLKRENIPAMLVNGRISAASFARFHHFQALFLPMFSCFSRLAMQTVADRDRMAAFGIDPRRLPVLGNLKYAAEQPGISAEAVAALLPPKRLWVCGSTHPGEEEIIFTVFRRLRHRVPDLLLVLAPRHPERGQELAALATACGLVAWRRSQATACRTDKNRQAAVPDCEVFILDSIGELAACYFLADITFIGGSLTPEGGHNPLEAAWAGKAILFGRHMEDFAEIAADLTACDAARMVEDGDDLSAALAQLLAEPQAAHQMGEAALALAQARRQGVLTGHLDALTELLTIR
ncbi:MAG: 3-deoxy-D-manno-octulosonic acid transferase [Desulfobulbaceae bacterium]|jgi:3-deoxy-D-manno-octulosonic-acid transferase|nr:3-deoxy-D-manno-octulosonic acid transferase [Desulfobulbaceae bacterium]